MSMELLQIESTNTLDDYIKSKDNSENFIYFHKVPEICKSQPCILGIDEAGRGPVLGPMVYGIAFCPTVEKDLLIELGCDDSKQLTEEKRDIIFNEFHSKEIANSFGYAVEVISPNTISKSMYRRTKCSLNEISMNSAIGLINCAIHAGVQISEVYVDTVGPPEKYQEKLKKIFPQFQIVVEKKADSTFPIVSAASICAKVTRDHALKVWRFPEGLTITQNEFGSGYPGDPVTKSFLRENFDLVFGFPRLVRFSWSTAENALDKKAFDMIFDETTEDETNNLKMTNFFTTKNKDGKAIIKESDFFNDRYLSSVIEL